jgi:hypothetical protein
MSRETERAQTFIRHLLNNPALLDCTPLQKEEQILVFLDRNMDRLYPTLTCADFFPGASRQQIRALLIQELIKITGSTLKCFLQRIVYEQIDYSYLDLLGQQSIDRERIKAELLRLVEKVARKSDARMALAGPLGALVNRIPGRYVDGIYETRNYVRFELEKVQRLQLGRKMLKEMLATALLVRPSIYLLTMKGTGGNPVGRTIGMRFAAQAEERLLRELPSLHPEVVRSGVESSVSFLQNPELRATSRLVMLFSRLARDHRPNMKIDRGAFTPERSWFSVARRNYRYFGYDRKMIDELYKIAAERGW